jgi:hypothetical protein
MAGLFTLSQGLYNQPAPMLAVDAPHRHAVANSSSALANAQTTIFFDAPGDGLTFGINDALLLEAAIANFQATVPGLGLSSASVVLQFGGTSVAVAQSITTGLNIPDSSQLVVILQPYSPAMLGGDLSVWGGGLNYPLTLTSIRLVASVQNGTAAAITVASNFLLRYRKASGQQEG